MRTPDELKALYEEGAGALDMPVSRDDPNGEATVQFIVAQRLLDAIRKVEAKLDAMENRLLPPGCLYIPKPEITPAGQTANVCKSEPPYIVSNQALLDEVESLREENEKLREAAGPFVEWNNCMESDIDHRWIKVTAQEHDALREALKEKP